MKKKKVSEQEQSIEQKIAEAKEGITTINRCIKMAQQQSGDTSTLVEGFQKTREQLVCRLTEFFEEQRSEAPFETQLQFKHKFELQFCRKGLRKQFDKLVEQNTAAQERIQSIHQRMDETKEEINLLMAKILDREQQGQGCRNPNPKSKAAAKPTGGKGSAETGSNHQGGPNAKKRRALASQAGNTGDNNMGDDDDDDDA